MLLLDEPSTGLDPRQRERLWEFVLALAGTGTTVIYSTHHLLEAERYGHRLLVLADGERVFDGSADAAPRRGRRQRARLRGRLRRASCASEVTDGPLMRWLLLKDLQILRRSPLIVACWSPTRSRSAS